MEQRFFTDEEIKISRRRQLENKVLITTSVIWILICCSIFYKDALVTMAREGEKEFDSSYEYIFDENADLYVLPEQYIESTVNKQLQAVGLMQERTHKECNFLKESSLINPPKEHLKYKQPALLRIDPNARHNQQ